RPAACLARMRRREPKAEARAGTVRTCAWRTFHEEAAVARISWARRSFIWLPVAKLLVYRGADSPGATLRVIGPAGPSGGTNRLSPLRTRVRPGPDAAIPPRRRRSARASRSARAP